MGFTQSINNCDDKQPKKQEAFWSMKNNTLYIAQYFVNLLFFKRSKFIAYHKENPAFLVITMNPDLILQSSAVKS